MSIKESCQEVKEGEMVKLKSRWYEFWKPKEYLVLHCKHNWERIEEEPLTGWSGNNAGRIIILQCKNCGKLHKTKMVRNDY